MQTARERMNRISLSSVDTALYLPWFTMSANTLPAGKGHDIAGSDSQHKKGKSGSLCV